MQTPLNRMNFITTFIATFIVRQVMKRESILPIFWIMPVIFSLSISSTLAFADDRTLTTTPVSEQKICAYISSYAPGYDWQDRIESSLKATLSPHCTIQTFYMDSKKVIEEHEIEAIGLQATDFIYRVNANLVIVSDDNATRFVLKQHFRNSHIPFVFCGVNSNMESYGLPYINTTGMMEVTPFEDLFKLLLSNFPTKSHIALLSTIGQTTERNIQEFHSVVERMKLSSSTFKTQNQEDRRALFKQLQQDPKVDFIILDNYMALPKWDKQQNLDWVKAHTQKLTIATFEWMVEYAALGYTILPEEHGTWAGLASIEILKGIPVHYLSAAPNQKFILWKNNQLLENIQDKLPERILIQARNFQAPEPESN